MKALSDYSFGQIKVGESRHTSDLIVLKDEAHVSWVRREGHSLATEDLQWLLNRKPGAIIIDTGAYGVLTVPQNLIDALAGTVGFLWQHQEPRCEMTKNSIRVPRPGWRGSLLNLACASR